MGCCLSHECVSHAPCKVRCGSSHLETGLDVVGSATEDELPIGKDDAGEVEAEGTGPELIESTISETPTGEMIDVRTLALRKEYQ